MEKDLVQYILNNFYSLSYGQNIVVEILKHLCACLPIKRLTFLLKDNFVLNILRKPRSDKLIEPLLDIVLSLVKKGDKELLVHFASEGLIEELFKIMSRNQSKTVLHCSIEVISFFVEQAEFGCCGNDFLFEIKNNLNIFANRCNDLTLLKKVDVFIDEIDKLLENHDTMGD